MKTGIQGLIVLTLLILVNTSTAKATINYITDDGACSSHCAPLAGYPVLRGHEYTLTLVGQYVDLATKVEVSNSGNLIITNVGTASGSKTIHLEVLNTASGAYEVKLRYLTEFNGPDTFFVKVLQNGTISEVVISPPTERLNYLDVVIKGNNIGNAVAFTVTEFKVCEFHCIPGTGGDGNTVTLSVTSSTSTEAKLHISFRAGPYASAYGSIKLADKAGGHACKNDSRYCYHRSDGATDIRIAAVAPNFIRVGAGPVKQGDVLHISAGLALPAKSGGEKIFWQLTPSTSFVATPGSTFTPTGLNSFTIPAGQFGSGADVKLDKVPTGCPAQGCVGQFQAKMENEDFVIQTFTMYPPALLTPIVRPPVVP